MSKKRNDGYYHCKDGKLTEIPCYPFEVLTEGLWLVKIDKNTKSAENLFSHNIDDLKDFNLYATLLSKHKESVIEVIKNTLNKPFVINDLANEIFKELVRNENISTENTR
jgi:hypothetical protein